MDDAKLVVTVGADKKITGMALTSTKGGFSSTAGVTDGNNTTFTAGNNVLTLTGVKATDAFDATKLSGAAALANYSYAAGTTPTTALGTEKAITSAADHTFEITADSATFMVTLDDTNTFIKSIALKSGDTSGYVVTTTGTLDATGVGTVIATTSTKTLTFTCANPDAAIADGDVQATDLTALITNTSLDTKAPTAAAVTTEANGDKTVAATANDSFEIKVDGQVFVVTLDTDHKKIESIAPAGSDATYTADSNNGNTFQNNAGTLKFNKTGGSVTFTVVSSNTTEITTANLSANLSALITSTELETKGSTTAIDLTAGTTVTATVDSVTYTKANALGNGVDLVFKNAVATDATNLTVGKIGGKEIATVISDGITESNVTYKFYTDANGTVAITNSIALDGANSILKANGLYYKASVAKAGLTVEAGTAGEAAKEGADNTTCTYNIYATIAGEKTKVGTITVTDKYGNPNHTYTAAYSWESGFTPAYANGGTGLTDIDGTTSDLFFTDERTSAASDLETALTSDDRLKSIDKSAAVGLDLSDATGSGTITYKKAGATNTGDKDLTITVNASTGNIATVQLTGREAEQEEDISVETVSDTTYKFTTDNSGNTAISTSTKWSAISGSATSFYVTPVTKETSTAALNNADNADVTVSGLDHDFEITADGATFTVTLEDDNKSVKTVVLKAGSENGYAVSTDAAKGYKAIADGAGTLVFASATKTLAFTCIKATNAVDGTVDATKLATVISGAALVTTTSPTTALGTEKAVSAKADHTFEITADGATFVVTLDDNNKFVKGIALKATDASGYAENTDAKVKTLSAAGAGNVVFTTATKTLTFTCAALTTAIADGDVATADLQGLITGTALTTTTTGATAAAASADATDATKSTAFYLIDTGMGDYVYMPISATTGDIDTAGIKIVATAPKAGDTVNTNTSNVAHKDGIVINTVGASIGTYDGNGNFALNDGAKANITVANISTATALTLTGTAGGTTATELAAAMRTSLQDDFGMGTKYTSGNTTLYTIPTTYTADFAAAVLAGATHDLNTKRMTVQADNLNAGAISQTDLERLIDNTTRSVAGEGGVVSVAGTMSAPAIAQNQQVISFNFGARTFYAIGYWQNTMAASAANAAASLETDETKGAHFYVTALYNNTGVAATTSNDGLAAGTDGMIKVSNGTGNLLIQRVDDDGTIRYRALQTTTAAATLVGTPTVKKLYATAADGTGVSDGSAPVTVFNIEDGAVSAVSRSVYQTAETYGDYSSSYDTITKEAAATMTKSSDAAAWRKQMNAAFMRNAYTATTYAEALKGNAAGVSFKASDGSGYTGTIVLGGNAAPVSLVDASGTKVTELYAGYTTDSLDANFALTGLYTDLGKTKEYSGDIKLDTSANTVTVGDMVYTISAKNHSDVTISLTSGEIHPTSTSTVKATTYVNDTSTTVGDAISYTLVATDTPSTQVR